MDQYTIDDITERIDELIELLSKDEDAFCIAIEVAHQLRDEVTQVTVLSDEDE